MPVFSEQDKEKIHWELYDCVPANPTELDGQNGNGLNGNDSDYGFQKLMGSGNVLSFFQDIQRKTKLETNMDASGVLSRNSYEIRAMRVVIAPVSTPEDELGNNGGDTPLEKLDEIGGLNPRVVEEFIYNSVTTLRVGEKIYIEAPTFMFPAGAGPFAGQNASSHGEPNPLATWRFAEPIIIPPQQFFRVEISFPRGTEKLNNLKTSKIRVWMILDGFLTRDVQ